MKGNKGERRNNEWEISERKTEHGRLLTLGNELGVVEGAVGGTGWRALRWALDGMSTEQCIKLLNHHVVHLKLI